MSDSEGLEEAQGVDTTKEEPKEAPKKKGRKPKVTTAKATAPEPKPLKKGDEILVTINGTEQYATKIKIVVAHQRGMKVELPKGSPFTLPAKEGCTNCG